MKIIVKGVNKAARKRLRHDDFIDAALHHKEVRSSITGMVSKKHYITTVVAQKWALSCTDVKHTWLDGTTLLPYGHYALADAAQ